MPLTNYQINMLYEVYQLTPRTTTVVIGEDGQSRLEPDISNPNRNIVQRLQDAIVDINADTDKTQRVGEILAEFASYALDPSHINTDGYELRPEKNIAAIHKRLYPYTGVYVMHRRNNNVTPMG